MKEYDYVFVLPTPSIISYPAGGANIFYRLSSHIASRGKKVAMLFLKTNRLSSGFLVSRAARLLFPNNGILRAFEALIGNDYDYDILKNVDVLFLDENQEADLKAKKLFVTAWQTGYFANDYVKRNPGTKAYNIIQNFEDNPMFSGENSKHVKEVYGFKTLRKIVICDALYDKFKDEKPLQFNVAVDENIFETRIAPKTRDPYTVLLPLRKDKSKGSEYALAAVEKLRLQSDKYKFIAYGNMDRQSVPGHIEYYYKPKNKVLVDIYNKAAIFIFTSLIEGFGSPPLESMACGCATVLTDCKGVNEYAVNNVNCIVVPIKDSGSVAKAVARLASDGRLRNRLAYNGIKTGKKFSYKSMYKSFSSLFG